MVAKCKTDSGTPCFSTPQSHRHLWKVKLKKTKPWMCPVNEITIPNHNPKMYKIWDEIVHFFQIAGVFTIF